LARFVLGLLVLVLVLVLLLFLPAGYDIQRIKAYFLAMPTVRTSL